MSVKRRAPHSQAFGGGALPKFRSKGKQKESIDQRAYVKGLNLLGIGFFYRVKNMGTFDPLRKVYRKTGPVVAIPDICGYKKGGRAVFIEVKNLAAVEKRKKLIFKVKISDEQKAFLRLAFEEGACAGVAFTLEDCLAIAMDDPEKYPRHPRTYPFMDEDWLKAYEPIYLERRHALAVKKQDPYFRDITQALPVTREFSEKF